MGRANENSQRCVPSSRRGSSNRRHTLDSQTRRTIVPRVKQRLTHIVTSSDRSCQYR
jgi:hypothetical protein